MDMRKITTYQSGVVQASAYRNLNKHFTALLKDHGLTCMQWFVVGTIYDSGSDGITMTDLARKLQTGIPFTTNTINLLESKGMVERKDGEKDNRNKFVSISPDFISQCESIEKDLRAKLRESIYQHITPDDLRIYIKVMYQLSLLK
jgi:DNA-binding MarR family transcriptional regulator